MFCQQKSSDVDGSKLEAEWGVRKTLNANSREKM